MTFYGAGGGSATKLIDHLFLISVSEQASRSVHCYFSFPPIPDNNNTLKNIIPFCFPSQQSDDSSEPIDGWKDPWYHDFVLTDEQGRKRYACCLKSRLFTIESAAVETDNMPNKLIEPPPQTLISCICLISNQPRFNGLRALLEELFLSVMNRSDQTPRSLHPENLAMSLIHQIIIPPQGSLSVKITLPISSNQLIFASPSHETQMPPLDFSLLFLFESLSITHVVDLFSMLLLEKSILLHSKSPTQITRTCEVLLSFLYPLQWDMVYVPLVPEVLKDLTEAPTPFLMGGESSWVAELQVSVDFGSISNTLHRLPIDDNNVVEEEHKPGTFIKLDIDNDDLIDTHPERNYLRKRLPGRKILINKIQSLLKCDLHSMNSGYRDIKDLESRLLKNCSHGESAPHYRPQSSEELELAIRRVFLDWFLETFSGLPEFYRADGRFDDRKWLSSFAECDQEYYEAFVRTAMFRNFVDVRAADVKREQDYFDHIIAIPKKMCSKPRRHSRMPTFGDRFIVRNKASSETSACLTLNINPGICETTASRQLQSCSFNVDSFSMLKPEQYYMDTTKQLGGMISNNKNIAELHWMRGYCFEKIFLWADDFDVLKSAMNDYISVLESKSWFAKENCEGNVKEFKHGGMLIEKIRNLSGKMHTVDLESRIKGLSPRIIDIICEKFALKSDIFFDKDKDKDMMNVLKEESRARHQMSPDTADRLVLNCNPEMSLNVHIDSHETLEDTLVNAEVPPPIRDMAEKPIELSIRLADMMTSMFRVISDPPAGFESGFGQKNPNSSLSRSKTHFSSMNNLKTNPIFDFLSVEPNNSGRKSSSIGGNAEQDFLLHDSGQLKAIKRIPTFESFRRVLLALRYVKSENIQTDEEKICFWLNIRNTMFLHIIIEFGNPLNSQHRMTYLYHKPAYNIGGNLFSLNEITYGILKSNLPLPTFCTQPVRSNTASSSSGNISKESGLLSPVHVTTTSVTVKESSSNQAFLAPSLQHHATIESASSVNNDFATFGTAKVPLKFVPTDARAKFKVLSNIPFINFALVDGSRSGPRMRVYQSQNIDDQLKDEAKYFIQKHVEFGKKLTFSPGEVNVSQSAGLSALLSGGSKKRRINLPQYIIWHGRDFINDSPTAEQLLAFFCFHFPDLALSKFVRDEGLIKIPSRMDKILKSKPLLQYLEIISKVQQSEFDQRLVVKIKDHCWDFLVRTCIE